MAKQYFTPANWTIGEGAYQPELNGFLETIFNLGNGYMALRGTPCEGFSAGKTTPGFYMPLIYDLLPVNRRWWGGGRLNDQKSVMVGCGDYSGLRLHLDGVRFDPAGAKLADYERTLDMRTATLARRVDWRCGKINAAIEDQRFVSWADKHVAAFRLAFVPGKTGRAEIAADLVAGPEANWRVIDQRAVAGDGALLAARTEGSGFELATAMRVRVTCDDQNVKTDRKLVKTDRGIERRFAFPVEKGRQYVVEKFVAVRSSRESGINDPAGQAGERVSAAFRDGFEVLHDEHCAACDAFWADHDVIIEGDANAQQGIRYGLMQLRQSYLGDDARVNIGAKGISGPGYGGLYFWDSEIYMLPYYLYTDPAKAKNLVLFRHRTLAQARKRANWFGYNGAMYPWVTIDGNEVAADWEFAMMEIHINAAVPYAVWHYVEATGDAQLLLEGGAEMVLECCRFWADRVTWKPDRKQYLINAVTGPDEYAVLVNNNCYTNVTAKWTLEYGLQLLKQLSKQHPNESKKLVKKVGLTDEDTRRWRDIAKKMFVPYDEQRGIHVQDDSFLDLEERLAADIPDHERRLMDNWPWERLMRTQVLKQPDVLLLMFLLNDWFTAAQKQANYAFYEPRCIHDSSLSPCIHAIMAAEVGEDADAFRYYLHTARLDLDDVNRETAVGLHIACLAGSWMSVVNGFGGMRLRGGRLHFDPTLPERWERLSFQVAYRDRRIAVEIAPGEATFTLTAGEPLVIDVAGRRLRLLPAEPACVELA